MESQNQIKISKPLQVSFPAEIIVEILLRLSNKSLLRCRSVCKLWDSLISDPYFINSKYLSTTSSCTTITNIKLIFSNPCSISICDLSDALYDKSVSYKKVLISKTLALSFLGSVMASSCNGLVCFLDEVKYKYMFIWNLHTRVCNRISLGFYFGSYGFGYDESTDDYKFLAICQSYDPRKRRHSSDTRIYSVKTGIWNTIGDFPDGTTTMSYGDGIYSNGALHWVCGHDTSDAWMILSFHLATETYGQVLQPDCHDEDNNFILKLGALGEQLCRLCYYYDRRSDIWVMKVYGVKESWTKLFSMPYMPGHGIIPRYNTPLFISNDGKILFEEFRRLFVYDSKNGSSSEIKNFKSDARVCTFVESLVSPMPTPWLD